jgi:hypothetical protein
MSDLYEEDIVLWSTHQAELPRRRAAGELVNDAEMNWLNIAEEIESVGRAEQDQPARDLAGVTVEMVVSAGPPRQ